MTPEEFKSIGDAATVSNAAGHGCMWTGDLLEPELWEALRLELQRRFRRSTGETMAVLSIELHPVEDGNGNVELPQDVVALVIAAREAFDTGMLPDDENLVLDKALNAFSSRVPYENEPDASEGEFGDETCDECGGDGFADPGDEQGCYWPDETEGTPNAKQ